MTGPVFLVIGKRRGTSRDSGLRPQGTPPPMTAPFRLIAAIVLGSAGVVASLLALRIHHNISLVEPLLLQTSGAEQESLFREISAVLAPAGVYVQFQYSLKSLYLLKKYFSVRLRFTLFNIPPAFVYVCRKS